MTVRKLGAAATAFFLGTAALGAVSLCLIAPAQAAVSRTVGMAINEAKSLAAAGNYKGAMAKVNEAASAAKSPEENNIVSQMKNYIASKSGDASTAIGAKAKFANDFAAGNLREVIADGEILKKFNALDGQSMLVIAQSYYRLHDSQGCMNYIKRNLSGGGEDALQTLQRCAFDAGDEVTQRDALEQLVARTGKPDHWTSLLKLSERVKGMNDHNTLDIYRLKLLTGSIKTQEEYSTLAKIALQFQFPAESQSVVEKGIAAKALNADDRTNRLLGMAKGQAGASAANQAKALAAAQAGNDGDALVKLGEEQIGQGKAKDAIATIKAGQGKTLKDPANAQLRLGTAYLAAGQKPDAIKAFAAVKGDDKTVMVAHLYSLYARR